MKKYNLIIFTTLTIFIFGQMLYAQINLYTIWQNHVVDNYKRYDIQSAKNEENKISKCNICTLDCTLEEHFVLEFLKDNPKVTQNEIATHIKKSERTVKNITTNLQKKNLLERHNGKRNGYWVVKEI